MFQTVVTHFELATHCSTKSEHTNSSRIVSHDKIVPSKAFLMDVKCWMSENKVSRFHFTSWVDINPWPISVLFFFSGSKRALLYCCGTLKRSRLPFYTYIDITIETWTVDLSLGSVSIYRMMVMPGSQRDY